MKLEPCPFCASDDIRLAEVHDKEKVFWCGNCGAFGPNEVSLELAERMWDFRRLPK